ncbi:MAG: hypothetical protein JW874_11835 [Spirochaetales bacterium]|nr:hypothetical protein [Spirochaetales bacterium]
MIRKGFLVIIVFLVCVPVNSYRLLYAEDFYELYYERFLMYPEHVKQNISFLELALQSDFRNPLYALAKIEKREQYPKYIYLFKMHVNLLMVREYRKLALKYNKLDACFYNYPWKDENLKSLAIAEEILHIAFYYWKEAVKWSELASGEFHFFTDLQNWEDERYRIGQGELDYDFILNRDLDKLNQVREAFRAMNTDTY